MSSISLSTDAMKHIRMATQLIHVDIMDCLIADDKIVFVVKKGQLGAAIGKKGKNLQLLRDRFKKTIKFVEETDDKTQFINNLCKPYKVEDISLTGSSSNPVALVRVATSDKSKLIGKNGRNIELIRKLAQRHHNFKDVQIK